MSTKYFEKPENEITEVKQRELCFLYYFDFHVSNEVTRLCEKISFVKNAFR